MADQKKQEIETARVEANQKRLDMIKAVAEKRGKK